MAAGKAVSSRKDVALSATVTRRDKSHRISSEQNDRLPSLCFHYERYAELLFRDYCSTTQGLPKINNGDDN